MEFLEAIAEGMPTRGAAAIAQIPFETVRNWMSKNDPAFRPEFFRAFEKAKASAARKRIIEAQRFPGLASSCLLA
jgi:hypothetical protein